MSEYSDYVCQDCGRDMSHAHGMLGEDALEMHSKMHRAESMERAWEKLATEIYASVATLRGLSYNIKALDLEDAFHRFTDTLTLDSAKQPEADTPRTTAINE